MFFVNLQIFPYISNKDSQHAFIGQNILAADTRRQFKLFAWATCPGKSFMPFRQKHWSYREAIEVFASAGRGGKISASVERPWATSKGSGRL